MELQPVPKASIRYRLKLSPGAKGLGYLSPGPSSSIPPSSRDCRRPPIVHLAASLRRRPRRRSRPLLRPPRHLLDPPPRPPRVPSTPRRPLDRRVREAPPPTGLDAAPVYLHPNRARGELPHALLIIYDPFPLFPAPPLPGRSCTAAVGVPPPHAHRGQPLCGAARRRRAPRSYLASLAAGARRTPAAWPCAGRNAAAVVPWRARAGAGLGPSLTSGAQLSAPV